MSFSVMWFHGEQAVSSFGDADLERISELVGQLTSNRRIAETNVVRSRINIVIRHSHLLLARAGNGGLIVGMATLVPVHKPTGFEGHVEDVVVHESCRGEGLGRGLMEEILRYARGHLHMQRLALTSNPDNPARSAARALYAKLGFTERAGLFTLSLS